jgi:hypothetical protein
MLHILGQGQRPHEVGEIIRQGVKLEPGLVVAELAARQPGPLDDVLAFFDPLLRRAPVIVEGDEPFGRAAQVTAAAIEALTWVGDVPMSSVKDL